MENKKESYVIFKYPEPQDYILGAESAIKAEDRTSDWSKYAPDGELQKNKYFDSHSCTSFSFNNVLEFQLNYLLTEKKLSTEAITWFTDNGYIVNGKFNLSDRFLAIMSGTTDKGNDFRSVAECARTVGCIPESDLKFDGKNREEYLDKTVITEAMKAKALKFLDYILIQWEWSFFDNALGFNEEAIITPILKQSPIEMGITTPAYHAITCFGYDATQKEFDLFDNYAPFIRKGNAFFTDPNFAIRIYVSAKNLDTTLPEIPDTFTFKNILVYGKRSEDVKMLQRVLIRESLMKVGLDTGYFGSITLQAVKKFQIKYAINPTGNVGKITMAKLNSLLAGLKKKS